MKRHIYKNYVIDTDNLGRQYIYNQDSPYSEDCDNIIVGVGVKLETIKGIIDEIIDLREREKIEEDKK